MASVDGETPRIDLQTGAVAALASIERVGPAAIRDLIKRYGHPLAALEAAPTATELAPESQSRAAALLRGRTADRMAAAAAGAAARRLAPGDRLLAYGRPGYPRRLGRLHCPPALLWAHGPLPADAPRVVAIVGTRAATSAARALTRDLAAGLAREGVRIVSGLARGIDGEAHRSALAADGETVGVLGSGLDFQYPRENRDLYARLRRRGLLLTEFAPGIPPEGHNFPRRNRIVAALSDAVLVVQAPRGSGALLTSTEAEDIGIEVLACPGDVRFAGSAGCNELIRDGAGLVTCVDDVLGALNWEVRRAAHATPPGDARALTGPERALLDRLDREPAALDELAVIAGGIGAAAALLARLELDGHVNGLPGCRYEMAR